MKLLSLPSTLITGALLLVLWGASWAISAVDLGAWSIVIAIGIASVQVLLGAVVFMELASASASVVLSFLTGLFMFGLLVGFTVADVATRQNPPIMPPLPTHPTTLADSRGETR